MKKRITVILAAAMVVMAFLAGCSKPTDNGGKSGTDTPKKSEPQELTINLGSEPPSLDSAKSTDSVSFDTLNQVMEGLIRTGEGFKENAGIAETWTISPDGLTYTFNLRKGAKWSDGKDITSADFKYAWLRAGDPQTASDYGFFLGYIKGGEAYNGLDPKAADFQAKFADLKAKVAIETPDANTLKVTLAKPTPFFLGLMAFPTFLPQRQDIVEKYNVGTSQKYAAETANMVYNGPFKIADWKHEDTIVLAKNDSYWDAKAVNLTKVTFKMIKDTNTSVQMYEAKELDRVGLSGANVEKYKADPGFKTTTEQTTFWLVLNLAKNPAFANVNFRKAISAAVDRKLFVDNVLKNGSLPASGAIPPTLASGGKTFRSAAGELLSPTAKKDEAKQLWEKAKQELGVQKLTIKMLIDDGDLPKRMGEALQAMIQESMPGLTFQLDQVTFQTRLDRTKAKDYEIVFAGWGADYLDATTFLDLWKSNSSFNDPGWKNPQYDDLLKKADTEADVAKRLQMLVEAEKLIMTELPIIPVYHRSIAGVARPYIKNWVSFSYGPRFDLKFVKIEGKTN